MDEYEEFEDSGAVGGVRSMFGSVTAGVTPTVGFTPDDIAAAGRGVQRRRRAGAVLGTTASVAVVALTVPAFGGFGSRNGSGPASKAATGTTAPAVATAPPGPGGRPELPEEQLKIAQGAVEKLFGLLDPTGHHLASESPAGVSPLNLGGYADGKGHLTSESGAAATWSDSGKRLADLDPSKPYVRVQVEMLAADQPDQFTPGFDDDSPGRATPHVSTLSDGSTVDVRGAATSAGQWIQAIRTFKDGESLIILVYDASMSGPPPTPKHGFTPFPFTIASIKAVASADGIEMPRLVAGDH